MPTSTVVNPVMGYSFALNLFSLYCSLLSAVRDKKARLRGVVTAPTLTTDDEFPMKSSRRSRE
jgi:hypothetical protein